MKIKLWQARLLYNVFGMAFACSYLWVVIGAVEKGSHSFWSLGLAILTLCGLSLGLTACLTTLQRVRDQQDLHDAYMKAKHELEVLDMLEAKLKAKQAAEEQDSVD